MNNFFPGIDRLQQLRYWDLRTDYILHSKPDLPDGAKFLCFSDEFALPPSWNLILNNGTMTEYGWKGNLAIVNEHEIKLADISPPLFYDSFVRKDSGKSFDGNHAMTGSYLVNKTINGYKVSLFVPTEWLCNSDIVYPVTIDPTVSNTYTNSFGVMDMFTQFSSTCQATLNVTLPPGLNYMVTGASSQYSILAHGYIDQFTDAWGTNTAWAAGQEQHSRIGYGGNWSTQQFGFGNSQSPQTVPYNIQNLNIANGCYPGGTNLTFFWQGYQDFFPMLNGPPSLNQYGCVMNYQNLVANTWIVTVTYDTPQITVITSPSSPVICSGENTAVNISSSPAGATFTWTMIQSGTSGASNGSGSSISQVLTTTGNSEGTATYTITPTLNGCPGAPHTLEIAVLPAASSSFEDEICLGQSYSFGGNNYTSSGTYTAAFQTGAGCDSIVTLHLDVVPFLTNTINETICEGMSYSFGSNSYTNSGVYESTFTSAAGCDSIVTLNLIVTPPYSNIITEDICEGETYLFNGSSYSESGSYSASFLSEGGCDSIITLNLVVHPIPQVNIGDLYTACQGTPILLSNSGSPGNYFWSNGDTGQQTSVTQSGTYWLDVYGSNQCIGTDSTEVIFDPLPVIGFYHQVNLCEGATIELDAGNQGSTYEWSTGETSQTIVISVDGFYTVNVTSPEGCMATDFVNVTNICESSIFVPSAFTPNGDGINDYFVAYGENILEFEMTIYNRWGDKVFFTDDFKKGWNGSYRNGVHYVEDGIYNWFIRYRLIQPEGVLSEWHRLKGHVTILR
ncbi:MAG: gliding motility-associated C-terminal domain-containing protein [Crocinitomicaceae bacterium]|nr:gliding motility-associated C-terminal domain-containing protein [Crocinitomicaceae bacterium]